MQGYLQAVRLEVPAFPDVSLKGQLIHCLEIHNKFQTSSHLLQFLTPPILQTQAPAGHPYRKVSRYLTPQDIRWFLTKPFQLSKLMRQAFRYARDKDYERRTKEKLRKHFDKLVVENGPFKGMKFPGQESVGSTFYPKILGCYEKELWSTLEEMRERNYTDIINIGCAEGYYAVGLARLIPGAQVYAYDINTNALRLCKQMATVNQVGDSVTARGKCTAEELGAFPFKGRGLIVSDCEGFEKYLFTEQNVQNLANCDLLIETHDHYDETITQTLMNLFKDTHDVKVVTSSSELDKLFTYHFDGLKGLSIFERFKVLSEYRKGIAKWMVCTARV